jgi:hypothetical protein
MRSLRLPGSVTSALEGGRLSPAVFNPRSILILISRDRVDPGHMELSDATEKLPSGPTGDRSRDLPTTGPLLY